jgi:2-keto-4-pentenoate hydratase
MHGNTSLCEMWKKTSGNFLQQIGERAERSISLKHPLTSLIYLLVSLARASFCLKRGKKEGTNGSMNESYE